MPPYKIIIEIDNFRYWVQLSPSEPAALIRGLDQHGNPIAIPSYIASTLLIASEQLEVKFPVTI